MRVVSVGSNSNWKFPIQLIAYESYVFLSLGDLENDTHVEL